MLISQAGLHFLSCRLIAFMLFLLMTDTICRVVPGNTGLSPALSQSHPHLTTAPLLRRLHTKHTLLCGHGLA